MHLENQARGQLVGQCDRGLQAPGVGRDLLGIAAGFPPSSEPKMVRADAVRFSICDKDASSDCNSTGANVLTREPSSASSRRSSCSAVRAAPAVAVLSAGARSAIRGGTAAS